MPLDHYRTLGRSGLRVSPLCLGTMTFGEDLGSFGASVETSQAILQRYVELGGNFIDTANFYTFGHSETILGDHLARHPGLRDRLVLATKFCGNMRPGDPNGGGAGRKSIIWACEESLRRLKTDFIDLYWMHMWDTHTPIEETLRALDDLVRAGKVRYVGFSDTPAWKVAQAQTFARLRELTPLIALQIEYSLLERTVEGELLPMAQEMGLGVTPWSPLKGGLLSGKYTRQSDPQAASARGAMLAPLMNERTFALLDELRAVSREVDNSVSSVALAWLSAQPAVVSPILGARTLRQLDDNLAAAEVRLGETQLARLAKASTPQLNFPAGFLALARQVIHGGIQINGQRPPPSDFTPKADSPTY